ncbi:type II secretion system protein N [Cocleimonas sp. KMM 6892]|uniref:type II secretion system protein N n=1 Tax=unclassified Cocleimonas TaxID=2639732 RepID=UPI002DBBE5F1|nr:MULTISPECIES: type II secretion system protein N [unclassified Cocleimonas]MEB8432383.1 type II secretion system protein N [Cocleimonas sp. KMM 6892]MEC4715242.1 type II secretion system protein N [Cocleimonas sp. KMM 6895]MEC4745139.1 type II secretion system protein N [Cocleimonas sp. KMM 6896]
MKKIIFFGLIAFLLAAVWQLPLSIAQPYLEKTVKGLSLGPTSGTIWNGEAKEFTLNNNSLGEVNWKIQLLKSLTSFKLKSYFKVQGKDINAEGIAGIGTNKQLSFDDTTFDINSDYINKLQKNAKLSGNITGDISHATLSEKEVPQIKGIIDWKDGALSSPIKLGPGNYKAIVSPLSGDLDIKLSSNEAPIDLSGDIKLIKDWTYSTNISAKSSEPGIAAMLNLAGKKQANGSVTIVNKGDLSPFITP